MTGIAPTIETSAAHAHGGERALGPGIRAERLRQNLTPNLRGPFEVLALELAPRAASDEEAIGHDSEECLLVLRGRVEVELAGQIYPLEEGDTISIQRNLPHRVVNHGAASAEVLTIISPPQTF